MLMRTLLSRYTLILLICIVSTVTIFTLYHRHQDMKDVNPVKVDKVLEVGDKDTNLGNAHSSKNESNHISLNGDKQLSDQSKVPKVIQKSNFTTTFETMPLQPDIKSLPDDHGNLKQVEVLQQDASNDLDTHSSSPKLTNEEIMRVAQEELLKGTEGKNLIFASSKEDVLKYAEWLKRKHKGDKGAEIYADLLKQSVQDESE